MSTTAPAAPTLPPHVLGYRALKLWQRAMDLAADAHRVAHAFPEADQPALAADLRRAGAAVPTAVAAGALAADPADQQRALHSATAALARLETLAALAERVDLLPAADASALLFASGDVTRLLRGFTRSVAARALGGDARARTAASAAPNGNASPTRGHCVAEPAVAPEDGAPTLIAPTLIAPTPDDPLRPNDAQASAQLTAPSVEPPSMRAPQRTGSRRRSPMRLTSATG